eukprot:PhM_4_TR214/c0_g1_i1/m.74577
MCFSVLFCSVCILKLVLLAFLLPFFFTLPEGLGHCVTTNKFDGLLAVAQRQLQVHLQDSQAALARVPRRDVCQDLVRTLVVAVEHRRDDQVQEERLCVGCVALVLAARLDDVAQGQRAQNAQSVPGLGHHAQRLDLVAHDTEPRRLVRLARGLPQLEEALAVAVRHVVVVKAQRRVSHAALDGRTKSVRRLAAAVATVRQRVLGAPQCEHCAVNVDAVLRRHLGFARELDDARAVYGPRGGRKGSVRRRRGVVDPVVVQREVALGDAEPQPRHAAEVCCRGLEAAQRQGDVGLGAREQQRAVVVEGVADGDAVGGGGALGCGLRLGEVQARDAGRPEGLGHHREVVVVDAVHGGVRATVLVVPDAQLCECRLDVALEVHQQRQHALVGAVQVCALAAVDCDHVRLVRAKVRFHLLRGIAGATQRNMAREQKDGDAHDNARLELVLEVEESRQTVQRLLVHHGAVQQHGLIVQDVVVTLKLQRNPPRCRR